MRAAPGARMAQIIALWQSGELVAAAVKSSTQADLARRLGMSKNALACAIDEARERGFLIPHYRELRSSAQSTRQYEAQRPVDEAIKNDRLPPDPAANRSSVSDWDEEPTRPNIGMHTATVQYRNVDRNIEESIQQPIVSAQQEPIAMPTIAESLAERRRKLEISALKSRVEDLLSELEQCQFERDTAVGAAACRGEVTPIEPRETMSGLREATAVALASDWHIEERVDAASVNGVNVYNLDIARRRVERYFSGLSYLIRYHQDHFSIRDLILWLGGDLITGYLREENLEHNELSPVQAIATLLEWIPQGVRAVLDSTDIAKMRIPCSSGNHGRLTDKVRPSTREANSIEWLLYNALAREFAGEERVEFTLPQGSQTYVSVYGFVIRFTHGDETKFGGGIGGIMIPLRKAIAKWQTVRHADLNCIGHYHQEHFLRDLIVNGSLIGYSPYSLAIAAPYEDPRQAFFLVDRHRGVTFPSTIWVADREGLA